MVATILSADPPSGPFGLKGQKKLFLEHGYIAYQMSQCMRFPTIWYVRPAKPQISLRIRAV